jgi:NIMA (never in mitosis gene a)-related kinase 1/4/5
MELADSGDLSSKIEQARGLKQFIKESKIWHIFKHLLEGVEALHKANIAHRDIKSANIFLFKDGSVKLGDLNVSAIATEGVL